jgi:hypothetical protein
VSRRKVDEVVFAAAIGSGAGLKASLQIRCVDSCVGNNGVGRILDNSDQIAANRLSKSCYGQEQQEGREQTSFEHY